MYAAFICSLVLNGRLFVSFLSLWPSHPQSYQTSPKVRFTDCAKLFINDLIIKQKLLHKESGYCIMKTFRSRIMCGKVTNQGREWWGPRLVGNVRATSRTVDSFHPTLLRQRAHHWSNYCRQQADWVGRDSHSWKGFFPSAHICKKSRQVCLKTGRGQCRWR